MLSTQLSNAAQRPAHIAVLTEQLWSSAADLGASLGNSHVAHTSAHTFAHTQPQTQTHRQTHAHTDLRRILVIDRLRRLAMRRHSMQFVAGEQLSRFRRCALQELSGTAKSTREHLCSIRTGTCWNQTSGMIAVIMKGPLGECFWNLMPMPVRDDGSP